MKKMMDVGGLCMIKVDYGGGLRLVLICLYGGFWYYVVVLRGLWRVADVGGGFKVLNVRY